MSPKSLFSNPGPFVLQATVFVLGVAATAMIVVAIIMMATSSGRPDRGGTSVQEQQSSPTTQTQEEETTPTQSTQESTEPTKPSKTQEVATQSTPPKPEQEPTETSESISTVNVNVSVEGDSVEQQISEEVDEESVASPDAPHQEDAEGVASEQSTTDATPETEQEDVTSTEEAEAESSVSSEEAHTPTTSDEDVEVAETADTAEGDVAEASSEEEMMQEEATLSLSGTSWLWDWARDNNRPVYPVNPDMFVLQFNEGGRFTSETDCNLISGSFHIKENNHLSFSQVAITERACEHETQEQEYLELLAKTQYGVIVNMEDVPSLILSDSMNVAVQMQWMQFIAVDTDVVVSHEEEEDTSVMVPVEQDDNAVHVQGVWRLQYIQYSNGKVINADAVNATLIFEFDGGEFLFTDSCSEISGNYKTQQGSLQFSNVTFTEGECKPGSIAMLDEDVLSSINGYGTLYDEVADVTLLVTTFNQGEGILVFTDQ